MRIEAGLINRSCIGNSFAFSGASGRYSIVLTSYHIEYEDGEPTGRIFLSSYDTTYEVNSKTKLDCEHGSRKTVF